MFFLAYPDYNAIICDSLYSETVKTTVFDKTFFIYFRTYFRTRNFEIAGFHIVFVRINVVDVRFQFVVPVHTVLLKRKMIFANNDHENIARLFDNNNIQSLNQ